MGVSLYRCLIEEHSPTEPFFQVYWAYGDHLGEALARMRSAAAANGLVHPICREADPSDREDLPSDLNQSEDGDVYWQEGRAYFPPGPGFIFPYGVIPAEGEGPFDPDDIQPGYRMSEEDGFYTVEVNVPDERSLEDYLALLRRFEPFRVFWIKIHDHWVDTDEDHIYINEQLTTTESIEILLRTDPANTLRNGYITLTAYHAEGETNINISDHKKIVVLTRSPVVAAEAAAHIASLGYSSLDPFITIDDRIHHWHYRDPQGLARKSLIKKLKAGGFRHWLPRA